ncbi:MAG TPA: ATP-binding cassette domain-containing protein [Pyrinomonadaceae bacterium]|nr:ATP-binding cassette domain-containing protein [Pyrinomonadaceae bacterium]
MQIDIRKALESDQSGSFALEVSFTAEAGITILFGPSGSGKSTTLRAIAGISKPDQGRIKVGERTFFDSSAGVDISIQERRVGYVFQDYALFPHLTGEQNVSYGIKADSSGIRSERARAMLALFKVEHVRHRYPQNMSGGEQQRIALARALASDPTIVLLDEPLSAVDVETRSGLLDEIAGAQARVGIPFVYVTHNTAEAVRLGSQVVVLDHGRVKVTGFPSEIFNQLAEVSGS